MKIISWNVANRIKKQSLQLDALLSEEPDVIGLQEITNKTFPLWSKGLKKAGYDHIASSLDVYENKIDSIGPRRYGIVIASRWPLQLIDQSLLSIPWPERLLSVLIQNPKGNFEFHAAHIPCGSSHGWLKIDTFVGIYNFLAGNNNKYPRILCGDFNSPQAETIEGEIITWGQKIFKSSQVKIINRFGKGDAWDRGERNIIEGLAEYDLPDIFRLLNGYETNDFSWILTRFDHIFASKELNPKVCHYLHSLRDNKLSDHSAIEGAFEI